MDIDFFYPSLALPLVLLFLESSRLLMLLYFVVCVVAAGFDGVAVGAVYWVLFGVVRMVADYLGIGNMMRLKGYGRV